MSEGPSPQRRKSSRIIDTSALKEGDAPPANSSDSIKVLCRFRPIRANAKPGSNEQNVFNLNDETGEVEYSSYYADKKIFKFDKVFGENTNQVQVFDEVKGVIGSVLAGFNGTIMAYGQTSAGKSFTMEGLSLWEGENQGVIPRCVNLLFEEIAKSDSNLQFQVVVSFFEVYCEKIRDLLNPQAVNLKLRETKDNGFVVQDITEIYCTDRDSVMRVIEFGKTNRASAPTLMNAESSRSHSIVSVFVDQKDTVSGRQRRGNLFLVDLAGSEKVSKTGASGMRLEEAKNINSSLTTLGMVINSLCDGAGHVPYRDSKLTMILMEALGGNSKTTLIICCTKETSQQSETVSTLRFGERAKKIQNHAKVNEELSVAELKALLSAAQKEIATLKKKLATFRKSLKPGELPDLGLDDFGEENKALNDEAVADLRRQIEEGTQRLKELQQDADGLKSRLSLADEELESERIRFQTEQAEKNMYAEENTALRSTIAELQDKLVKQSLEMKKAVAKSVQEAEKALEQYDEATLSKELADVSELASAVDDGTASSSSASRARAPGGGSSSQDGATKSALRAAILEKAEAIEASLKAEAGDMSGLTPTKSTSNSSASPSAVVNGVELNKLQQESLILNAQMEAEILHLNQSVSQQAQEARNAMETAQKYADKYLKLREDYETHIERLMLKLTQEQQARTILEDQLESAMRKVFLFSKEIEKQRGGFFGWFSRKPSDFSVGGSTAGRSKAASEREMGIARSLELANLRIQQLQSENDQLRESHGIVVETKESVINTLSRRVTELSTERDLFKARMEDLTATVEQLTNLLRSTQHHQTAGGGVGGNAGGGNMMMAGGGGLGGSGGGGSGHFAQGMIKGGGNSGGFFGNNSNNNSGVKKGNTSSSSFINVSSMQVQQMMTGVSRLAASAVTSSQRIVGAAGGSIASISSARTSSLGSEDDDSFGEPISDPRRRAAAAAASDDDAQDADNMDALMNDEHASIASSSTDSQDSSSADPKLVNMLYTTEEPAATAAMPARPVSTGSARRPLPPVPPVHSSAADNNDIYSSNNVNTKMVDTMLSSSSSPVADTMFLTKNDPASSSRDSDDSPATLPLSSSSSATAAATASDQAAEQPTPLPRLTPQSTTSSTATSRPPIFPPSPSTAAALAASSAMPSNVSNSIAQRMAGVMKTQQQQGAMANSTSSERLSNMDAPAPAPSSTGAASAASTSTSTATTAAARERPTLNLAALSAGKVRPSSSNGLSPLGSGPVTPHSTTSVSSTSTAGIAAAAGSGFGSNFASSMTPTNSSSSAAPAAAAGSGTSSFASRLSGVLDAPAAAGSTPSNASTKGPTSFK